MPDVRAFRALRFTLEAGPLADLVAPPYDVIGAAERERMVLRSPNNLVNITLPEGDPNPARPGNRYERAGSLISSWRAAGVLAEDAEPTMTVVQEEFDWRGGKRRRTGLQAAARLTSYGEGDVYPHEGTLSRPRADRLALMRTTKANLSPVFVIVPDPTGEIRSALSAITSRPAEEDMRGPDEARRRMWIERDPGTLESIEAAMAGLPAVIADGHHRYETALAYRDEVAARGGDAAGASRVLCHVVPVEDEGLVVLPYHRVVSREGGARCDEVLQSLRGKFDLAEISRDEAVQYQFDRREEGEAQGFVLAAGGPARQFRARLRDRALVDARAPGRDERWRGLDVACLHLLVLEDVLGITPDLVADGEHVTYTRSAEEVLQAVGSTDKLGFILRATPPEAVLEVARAGERMPQKSTYFYPKVAAGFAMLSLEQRLPRRR